MLPVGINLRDRLDDLERNVSALRFFGLFFLLLLVGVWLFAGLYAHHVGSDANGTTVVEIAQLNRTVNLEIGQINVSVNNFFLTIQRIIGNLAQIIAGTNPPPPSLVAPPGSLYLASTTNTLWYYFAGSGWQKQIDCTENQGPPGPPGPTGNTGPPGPAGSNGTSAESLIPYGPWNSNTTYPSGAVVSTNDTIYIAIVTNVNIYPSTNISIWMVGITASSAGNPTSGFFYPIVQVTQANSGGGPVTYNSTLNPDLTSTLFAVWQNTVVIAGPVITVGTTGVFSYNINVDYLGQLIFHSTKIDLIITQTRASVAQALYTGSYLLQDQNLAVSWSNSIYMQAGDQLEATIQYLLEPGDTLDVTGSISLQQLQ